MALPEYIGTYGAQGGSIAVNANWPNASVQANDIGYETMLVVGATPAATAPSGWTEISNELISATARLITIWKRCDALEPDHTWTSVSGGNRFIISSLIRGCVTTGDPWDVASSGQATSSTAFSANLGTTVYSDCLYVVHVGRTNGTTMSGQSAAALSDLIEEYDTASGGISRTAYSGGLAVAGNAGTLTATISSAAVHMWSVIALKSTTSALGGTNSNFLAFM